MKINHAILHVFDFVSCANVYAQEEIDQTNKNAKNYVAKHVRKALANIDNKRGEFAPDSMFAEELRAYFRGERNFVDLSAQIAEFVSTELGRMEKSTSTDLLVVDFEDEPQKSAAELSDEELETKFDGPVPRYFAIMLLESKQAFMHEVSCGETGQRNDIVRHYAILPNPSQKVQSYAIIDLRNMNVRFVDKQRKIAGEERYLIPEGLLQCSMQASTKETFAAVTEVVEAVAEEYGANSAVALSKAKSYAAQSVEDTGDIDMAELADEVFEDNPEMQKRFEQAAEAADLPERVPLERTAVKRVAKSHKIRTDTGIEITFPAEYSKSPEFITFTSEANGMISIQLKNISHIENR